MTKLIATFSFLCCFLMAIGQETEPYLNNETYTFSEVITEFKKLVKKYPAVCHYQEYGSSDYGHPMPLFVMNAKGLFTAAEYQSKNVLLINNAIHPGEPCGVDASVKLAKTLLKNNALPKDLIIAIIPIYNIGGAHNRGCCSRANQNGPVDYGFRGNAKNLDLNRDFIKADSKNVRAFYSIFHLLNPAVFVDTHTSNGADYQHTLTLITSQLDKMNPILARYTRENLNPYLFEKMEKDNYPMVPYIHTVKGTPDNGIMDYLETPRYSTGYTNLFNTVSYVTEAHMLKPYADRVESTYLFLEHMINYMNANATAIKTIRNAANKAIVNQTYLDLNWELDTTKFDTIRFKGYAAEYKTSKVTGNDRLFYNHELPYEKYIRYYNRYQATDSVSVPEYYIIPQAWQSVIDLFRANNIEMHPLMKTAELEVEIYEILDYETRKSPYEGHYIHSNISTASTSGTKAFRKGDFVVPVKNKNLRFIMETLEPRAVDSYFAWNYFDAILQQKEWFSAYVFEDEAAEILKTDPELKAEFENQRATDSTFAKSDFAQLYFIYKRSSNYERTTNQFPIVRCMDKIAPELFLR